MRCSTNSSRTFGSLAGLAVLAIAGGLSLLVGAAQVQAQTAEITYNGSLTAGPARVGGPYTIGSEFQVGSSNLTVSALGAQEMLSSGAVGSGFASASAVGVAIWNASTNVMVASVTNVDNGSETVGAGGFAYINLGTDVTLTAGQDYYIGAFIPSTDYFGDSNASGTYTANSVGGITILGSDYSAAGSLAEPTSLGGTTGRWGAANFLVANGPDTWVGNTSATWSTAGNWTGINTPPASGDSLVFGAVGSAGATLSDNLMTPSTFNVGGITFNSGGAAFTISPATPGTNGFTLTGNVTNSGANLQTINDMIALSGASTFTTTTGGGNITLGGTVSGTGSLVAAGSGTLTLSGANTHSGGTALNSGTLAYGTSSTPSTANATVTSGPFGTGTVTLNGGTLDVTNSGSGDTSIANAIVVSGTTTLNSAGHNMDLNGPITGSGTLNNIGATLFLEGNDSAFAGTLNLNTGSSNTTFWAANSSSALATYNLNAGFLGRYSGGVNSATINLGSLSGVAGTTLGDNQSSSGAVTTYSIGALNTNTTFAGTIANSALSSLGTVAVTKVGTGTLTLGGANTYTGTTTVSTGTLVLGTSGSLNGTGSSGGPLVVASGATLIDNNTGNNVLPYNTVGASWTVSGTINVNSASPANTLPQASQGNSVTLNGGTLTSAATNTSGYGPYFVNGNGSTIIANGTGNNINAASVGIGGGVGLTLNTPLATDTLYVSSVLGATGSGNAAGGLTKSGLGTVTLNGANIYTGATTVSAGTLDLASTGSLSSTTTVNSTGTFTIAVGASVRTFASNLILNGGTVRGIEDNIGSGGTIAVSGGNVIHTFTSSGTLTLPGTVTASGLVVGGGGSGGAFSGGMTYGDGGGGGQVLSFSGASLSTGAVTVGSGGASASPGGNGTASSVGSESAAGGLGGTASGAGGTSGSGNAGGAGGNAGSGSTYDYAGGGGGGNSAAGGSAGYNVGGNGGAGTLEAITGLTYGGGGGGGTVAGTAGLGGSGGGGAGTVAGSGTSGTANTGGGGGAGDAATAGTGGSGIVVVQYGYVASAGSVTLGGTIDVQSNSTLDAYGSGGSLTVNGVMSDVGGITIASSNSAGGVVTYGSQTNTYSGTTRVSAGATLVLGSNLSLENSAIDTSGTGAINLTGITTPTIGGLIDGSGSQPLASVITSGYGAVTALTLNPGSGVTDSYSGVIADGATGMTLTMSGAGTQTLGGTNTYTGATTITAGTLNLTGSIAAASTVGVGTAGTLSGTGTVNGNATLTGNGIINLSGLGNIVGTLGVAGGNWNGFGSVNGVVTSSSGTFTVGSGANLMAGAGLNVTGGSIASGNSASTITGSVNYTSPTGSTFGGVIAGNGNTLTVNSPSTALTLSGGNTYTGTTNVNAGTLRVTGSLANTTVTVASGATLAGSGNNSSTGVLGGNVQAAGGSAITLAGASSTPLTFTNGLTLGTSGYTTLNYTLAGGNNAEPIDFGAGGSFSGTLTINSGNAFVNPSATNIAGAYVLANFGSLAGSGAFTLSTSGVVTSETIGRNSLALSGTANQEVLTIGGASVPAVAYWYGGAGTYVWNDITTSQTLVNWSTDAAGATDAGNTPGPVTDVILNAGNQTGTVTTMLGGNTTINSLNVNGNGTNTVAFDGSTLTINALGDNNHSSDNNYTGNPIGQGILIGSAANAFTIDVPVTLGNSQTWINGSANTFTVNRAVSSSASSQTLTLQNTSTGNTIISGAIGGTLAVIVNSDSSSTVALSGNNTFSGGITLTAGTLDINSTTALGAAASTFTIAGGAIDNPNAIGAPANNNPVSIGGSFSFGGTNPLNLGAGTVSSAGSYTITLNGNNALTFGGILTNTAANGTAITTTVNNGSGTGASTALNLAGFNLANTGTTTGVADVINGTANVNITGAVANGGSGASGLTYSGTGTLTLSGTSTYTGATGVGTGGTLSLTGTVGSSGGTAISSAGTFTESSTGVIAGTSSLSITGGTTSLAGTNTYSGNTSISTAGTLRINGTGTLGGGSYAGTISNAGALVYNSSTSQTLSGQITGAGTLAVSGGSTLTLSSNSTNYTGGTSITNGTLVLQNITSFASPIIVNSNTTLEFNNATGSGNTTTAGTVNLQGELTYIATGSADYEIIGAVTVNATSTVATTGVAGSIAGLYLDGGLAGSSNVTVTGNTPGVGLVLRNSASTYSGTMTVNGTHSTAVGGGSGLVVGNRSGGGMPSMPNANLTINGTLEMGDTGMASAAGTTSGQIFQINALAGSGDIVSNWASGTNTTTLSVGNNGGGGNFSGIIADGQDDKLSFTKNGSGTQTLGGTNTYTGATTISAGTLNLTGSIAFGSTVGIATAGALSGTGTVNGNATLTGSGIINLTSPGNIVGTLSVTGGNWNGSGSVTGLVTSSSGAFTIGASANLAASAGLDVTGGSIAGTGTITGSVDYTSPASSTFNGVIAGSGNTLTLNNASATLTLGGANTYDTGTTVTAGTLRIGNPTALGANTGAVGVASGAVLDLAGTTMTGTNGLTLNGTGISGGGALTNSSSTPGTYAGLVTLGGSGVSIGGTGTIALSNTGTIGGSGDNLTLQGAGGSVASIIGTGTGTLTVNSTGAWQLSGANTFTGGVNLNSGTLRIGNAGALNSTTPNAVTFGATSGIATLDVNGYGTTVSSLAITSGAASNAANQIITNSNTSLLGPGTLTYAGATPSTFAGTLQDGGSTLALNVASGALTLSGNSTYSGGTTISGGTLRVANIASTSATGSGPVAVNSGTTLTGAGGTVNPGYIGGTVNIAGGGTIAPAGGGIASSSSIGTLTVGNLTLNNGATSASQLNYLYNGSASPSLDEIAVTSVLTLPTATAANEIQFNFFAPGSTSPLQLPVNIVGSPYVLMTYGSLTNTFNPATLSINPADLAGGTEAEFSSSGNAIDLSIVTIVTNGSATWASSTDTDYGTAANWSPHTVPSGIGLVATFGTGSETTVSVNGAYTVGQLNFNNGGNTGSPASPLSYNLSTDNGGSLTLNNSGNSGGASVNVSSGGLSSTIQSSLTLTLADPSLTTTFNIASGSSLDVGATINESPAMSGQQIVLSGGGTLQLDSGANSYTGGTTVNGGTLILNPGSGTAPLGGGSLAINAGNGVTSVVNVNAPATVGSLSGSESGTGTSQLNVASFATLTVNQSTSGTFTGTLSLGMNGGLVLQQASGNTLTISGASSLGPTSTIAVNSGTLALTNNTGIPASIASTATVSVAPGATLQLAGTSAVLSSTVNITTQGSGTSGDGTLSVVGTTTQTVGVISGNTLGGSVTTYAGNTTIGDGTNAANLTATQILQNTLTINAGSTVTIAPSGPGIETDAQGSGVGGQGSEAVSGVALAAGSSDSNSDSSSDPFTAIQAAIASGSISSVKGEQLENRIAAIERLAATDPGLDVSLLEDRVLAALPAPSVWSSSGTAPLVETGSGLLTVDSSTFASSSDAASGSATASFAPAADFGGSPAAVPEPSALLLAAMGGIGMALAIRRRTIHRNG